MRLDQITVAMVDDCRRAKVAERGHVKRPLGNNSINRTLQVLSRILAEAVDDETIERSVAAGRRRRLKVEPPPPKWLEADQVEPLLDAAGRNRPVLATAVLAGLRAQELCDLRWQDVDLARGRITVRASKTAPGRREVPISPRLQDELGILKASVSPAPGDRVFLTSRGTPQNRHNLRRRVLAPAVKRANERLAEQDKPLINERLTTHSLRHSAASLWLAAGATVPETMAALEHSDPSTTLRIYAHVLRRSSDFGLRVDALIDWAQTGTNHENGAGVPDRVAPGGEVGSA